MNRENRVNKIRELVNSNPSERKFWDEFASVRDRMTPDEVAVGDRVEASIVDITPRGCWKMPSLSTLDLYRLIGLHHKYFREPLNLAALNPDELQWWEMLWLDHADVSRWDTRQCCMFYLLFREAKRHKKPYPKNYRSAGMSYAEMMVKIESRRVADHKHLRFNPA